MRFATSIPQFYAGGEFDPEEFRAYFSRAEELGYESAWAQEQTLGAAPQLSPVEAMTYAAAVTSRMRLGCVVFVSTLHSPVHLAKSLATLDQLSKGRIDVGVGTGGPRRPFAAFGVASPTALRRAVRLGDGFFGAGSSTTEAFAQQVVTVREALAAAGKSAADFPIAKRVYISIDSDADRARRRVNAELEKLYGSRVPAIEEAAVAGTVDGCLREVRRVAEAGAELILFTPLHDQAWHAEQIAAEIIPQIG